MQENRSKIAVVAALEREVRPLIKGWAASEKQHEGRRFRFFEQDAVVVVCAGIGPEAARRAAEAVIHFCAPDTIYSAGYAGALDSKLRVGDILRPQRVVNASDGSSVNVERGSGVLVSFGAVAGAEQKRKLRESFGAQAVDMEAAAVARAAEARGVRFEAIKAISDEADFDFPEMGRFVDASGAFSEWKFGLFAAIRPWLWAGVVRMVQNSARASRALCGALGEIG